ncbi:MAG: LysM peptidoglycan-binding domain-containing protein [Calditrichaeota bacterium]|nr:LysM peptidoglycan-binding domain-containing protein [Calditrichota bacterium]RQW07617.1 MAG: LysM peptidoglycan-binding domain-containing protein [Calditrichota bacterium]
MKKAFLLSIVTLIFFSFSLFAQDYSYDYENMSMDEYNTEMAKWQKCEADNKAKIADEEAQIAKLNEDMAAVEKQIEDTWGEIYSLMGTDEAGYQDYLNQLKSLENELSGFVALSPEDIYTRMGELQALKDRLAELKKDKRSLTSEAQNYISRIENLIAQAEEKGKPAAAGMYQVMRGDYLWKIARKSDIYGDPYAWVRIYTYNRDQINDPNLIYPNQTFRIPRMAGPNEHWVERGEFLSKIAGYSNVYGNPFQWQRIYEANKTVITDPNLIYPHMILNIPR